MEVIKRHNKSLKELSDKRQFYELIAKTKGDTDEYWATGFSQSLLIEKIQKILQGVVNKRIIDVGCGDGRTIFYLAKRKNTVIGIDISHTRLSRAKQKVLRYSNHTLAVQSYAEALPIKGKVFDGAVCTEVLEHVIDDDALLRGLSQVVKPHAWVLISIPTVSMRRYFDMLYTKKPIYFDPIEHVREFTHYKIPFLDHNFILTKNLKKKLKLYGLIYRKHYGIAFQLPLGVSRFKIGKCIEKICMNKRVNKIISKLPIFKNFGVYTIFLLRKKV